MTNYYRLNCGCLYDDIIGDKVIAVGGFGGIQFEHDPTNSSKSMEIYDFDKNKWFLNSKLLNHEHEEPHLFKDKNNPNLLYICGNHCDPKFYGRKNDAYIEFMDLRDPFPKYKWSLYTEKSLIQLFNVDDDLIRTINWRCNYIANI